MFMGRALLIAIACLSLLFGAQTAPAGATPDGTVLDGHKCYALKSGSQLVYKYQTGGDCFVPNNGTIYAVYNHATLSANNWSAAGLTPLYYRDFADPSGQGLSANTYIFTQAVGSTVWYREGGGPTMVYYGSIWMTVNDYNIKVQANAEVLAKAQAAHDDAMAKINEIILRPACDYSSNGCA